MGARLGIYPMEDNFVEVILDAVSSVSKNGLAVMTDDLGTIIQGPSDKVFSYVEEVFVRASNAGGHVIGSLVLSAG